MFKHFILTRFNIKFDGIAGFDKNNQFVQTEEWLEYRFSLFEKYCLPSIMNQTCKNFIWFVLFSSDTPERFVQKIKSYELQFPLFKPLYLKTGDYDTIKKISNSAINLYLKADDQYVITSRIDNDDAFHRDMVREVQGFFDMKDDTFLSFTYGLQWDLNKQVLTRMHYRNNHFISRIEEIAKGIETVILYDHTYIDKVAEVIYLNNRHKPMWLEIIHGGNLVNSLNPDSAPLFTSKLLWPFNCKGKISLVNTLLMFFKYLKLKVLLVRADFLRKLGIYDFLKKIFRKK